MPAPVWALAAGGIATVLLIRAQRRRHRRPVSASARATARTTAGPPTATATAMATLRSPAVALVTGVGPGTMGEGVALELASMGCSIAAVEHPLRRAEAEAVVGRLRLEHGATAG